MDENTEDVLLTTRQAAGIINLTERFLENRRLVGGGPRFLKLGTRVRYRRSDLDSWLADNAHAATADYDTGVSAGAT